MEQRETLDEPYSPTVEAHLVVSGEFDPDELTRITSLTPTRARRRGERLGQSRAHANSDQWIVVHGPFQTMDGTQAIQGMLEVVEELNKRVSREWTGQPFSKAITLVAYVPPHRAQAVPNVSLTHALLDRLAQAGVDLDFDFMLLEEESGN